jgi:GNAT superfamily N-acetyltransferase
MWRVDAAPQLVGGELRTEDGEQPTSVEQGLTAVCGSCDREFEVTSRHTANRQFPTIPCSECERIIAIQYDKDDPFEMPWEILDLSDVVPDEWISSFENTGVEEYRVFVERSDELTRVHRAGECMARATKMEFYGQGKYSIPAMNVVVLAEPSGVAVGYLTWNTFDSESSTYPALRQLYLMPAYRRRGLGSVLLKFWTDEVVDGLIAETPQHVYCVESPNDDMVDLIHSVGHHDENDGGPSASFYTPHQV